MTDLLKIKNKGSCVRANRVVVRPLTPWYYYLFFIFILIVLLAGLVWGAYKVGLVSIASEFTSQNTNVPRKMDSDNCLQNGSQELCSQLSSLRRQLRMNSAIHENLNNQIKLLGEENSRLKEELDFFQYLMSGGENVNRGISIHRFKLMNGQANNAYRYSLSLVQGSRRPKQFEGTLRFLANLRQNDQRKTVSITSKSGSIDFPVQFKFYHRLEESFQVSPDTIVEGLEVQLFEKNVKKVKLTQTVKLSP